MLTSERCDECITVIEGDVSWGSSHSVRDDQRYILASMTPDEAELFAYRLLDAVKRARGAE